MAFNVNAGKISDAAVMHIIGLDNVLMKRIPGQHILFNGTTSMNYNFHTQYIITPALFWYTQARGPN